jgi:hypothetical protein
MHGVHIWTFFGTDEVASAVGGALQCWAKRTVLREFGRVSPVLKSGIAFNLDLVLKEEVLTLLRILLP